MTGAVERLSGPARWLGRPAARRSLLRLSADVIGRILQLLVLIAIARTLDEGTFGTIALGAAAGLIIGQLADLGLQLTVSADVARRLPIAPVSIGSALLTKAGLSIVAIPLYVVLFIVLGSDDAAAGAALVAAAVALDTFIQFSATTLRAASAFWQDWLTAVVPRAIAAAFVIPVALAVADPRLIGAAWLSAAALSAGIAMLLLRSQLAIGSPDAEVVRELLRRSWPIGASIVVGMAYTRVGLFTLEALKSSSEVAVYAVASRMVEPAYLLPAAGTAIFYPSYTRTLHEQPGSAPAQLIRWLVAMAAIGAAAYLLLAVAGPLIASLLFGEFYTASGELLRLLGLVLVPGFVSYVLNQALIARGQARYNLLVMSALLVFAVITSIWAVSAFGTWGAASVAVAVEILLFAALVRRMRILGR
jgi:O-antigen/teichoic acid export membrane protein